MAATWRILTMSCNFKKLQINQQLGQKETKGSRIPFYKKNKNKLKKRFSTVISHYKQEAQKTNLVLLQIIYVLPRFREECCQLWKQAKMYIHYSQLWKFLRMALIHIPSFQSRQLFNFAVLFQLMLNCKLKVHDQLPQESQKHFSMVRKMFPFIQNKFLLPFPCWFTLQIK